MLTNRRHQQPTAGGHHFTFSDPTGRAAGQPAAAGVEYGTWAERIKGRYGYFGRSDERSLGAWTRRTAASGDGEEEFRWLAKVDEDGDSDSDVQSPTLWNRGGSPAAQSAGNSPAGNSPAGNSPARDDHSHGYGHPSARAQVIARYRQEMLDMVKDMPENAYELSLRDMVESPGTARPAAKAELRGGKEEKERVKKAAAVKKGSKKMARSESMDAASFMLKMFVPRFSMPALFGGRRRSSGSSGKVSPRPMVEKSKDGGEWWNKEEYGDMSSSNGSSNSSTTTNRSRRKLSGCSSFFRTLKRASTGI